MSSLVKNKKGINEIIGYILLIAISIVMSILVYQWLKTYVPKDIIKCDEGTSVFLKDIWYNCSLKGLNITLKNNGKFSVDGFFIHASNVSNPDSLAVIDLSSNLISGGSTLGNAVRFSPAASPQSNSLTPDLPANEKIISFNVSKYGQLYKIEIIPTRIQTVGNINRTVSCNDIKIEQLISCS